MSSKKITIVNRHYPPNVNITGENAWDLANYLINEHGIDVAIVHIEREYFGGGDQRKPVGKIHSIKTIYQGKNKYLAYLSGFIDGYKLIKKASKLNHGPTIVMTSPPLLPMWASRIFHKKKKDWILWSMDLFPEGFAATKEFNKNSFLYKYALKQTYKNAPEKLIALGPEQKKLICKKYDKDIDGVILPCGVFKENNSENSIPAWKKYPNKIYLGYVGNCGGPHSPEFIKAVINQINPEKHHFVLATYGTKSEQVIKHAEGKEGVTILKSIPRNELNHIDVHLVTLVNSWTHVAVPSKAISSICSNATILFCGNKDSDNWQLLNEGGWLIEDNNQLKENISSVLNSINKESLVEKKKMASQTANKLNALVEESYRTIAGWAK